jgi:hypothetical protein
VDDGEEPLLLGGARELADLVVGDHVDARGEVTSGEALRRRGDAVDRPEDPLRDVDRVEPDPREQDRVQLGRVGRRGEGEDQQDEHRPDHRLQRCAGEEHPLPEASLHQAILC